MKQFSSSNRAVARKALETVKYSFVPGLAGCLLLVGGERAAAQPYTMDFESGGYRNNTILNNANQSGRRFDDFFGFDPEFLVKGRDIRSNARTYETQIHNGGREPTLDTNIKRSGDRSLRFDLRNSVSLNGGNRRSEIWFVGSRNDLDPHDRIDNSARVGNNQKRYYGFSFRLPRNFRVNSQWIISQWWQNGPRTNVPGEPPAVLQVLSSERKRGPNTAIYLSAQARNNRNINTNSYTNETFDMNVGGSSILGTTRTGYQIDRETWYDVIVEFKFRPAQSNGSYMKWWISPSDQSNYNLAGELNNTRIGYGGGDAGKGFAIKYGVYSTAISDTRRGANGNDETDKNTTWFDNVSFGSRWSDVNPKVQR